jgi:hypothetical protein
MNLKVKVKTGIIYSQIRNGCHEIREMFKKIKKSLKIHKIWKILKFIGFIYQLIDSTITYCQFETVFDLKSKTLTQETPSFSLCINSRDEFLRINKIKGKDESVGEYIYRSLICKIRYNEKSKDRNCREKFEIIESVTHYAYTCITFFSQITVSNKSRSSFINSQIVIIPTPVKVNNTITKISTVFHQTKTLPHFFRDYFIHKTKNIFSVKLISTKEQLLPFPYQTNCDPYEQNSLKPNAYKSREHCILDQMKRLEYEKCKCYRKWFYESLIETKHQNICLKNNCSVEFNQNILFKKCRPNCYNEYYNNRILMQAAIPSFANKMTVIYICKIEEKELFYIHLPKMDFIQYLSSFGGLISLWFGYSVYQISIMIFETKFVDKFLTICARYWPTIGRIFKKFIVLIILVLMSYQVFEVIYSYYNFETIFKSEISQKIYLPKIRIYKYLDYNEFKSLVKIYPEMKDKIIGSKNLSNDESKQKEITNLYTIFLKKMLEELKHKEFLNILKQNDLIKSCYIVIPFCRVFNCMQ